MSLCSFFRDLCILTTNPFLLFWSHHPDPCWFGTLLYIIGLGKLIIIIPLDFYNVDSILDEKTWLIISRI